MVTMEMMKTAIIKSAEEEERPAKSDILAKLQAKEKKVVQEVQTAPFHVHHGLIGAGIMVGGVVAALTLPVVKPTTRLVVAGSAFVLGLALLWDDIEAHLTSKCGFDTWINFVPCPETVTVVRKPENEVKKE